MHHLGIRATQRGVVLVVGLLLLLAMTLVAVGSMSATHMQERMAGNHRTQALAFNAASIGAADAVNYYISKRDAGELPGPCRTAASVAWGPTTPDTSNAATLGMPAGTELRRSLACVTQSNPDCAGLGAGECPDFRSQLLVLNQGRVIVAGQAVAQREVEVRIDYLLPPGQGISGCSGICMPGCNWTDPIELANSRQFVVDGGEYGDPAISVGCDQFAEALIEEAEDNGRLGNYSWQGDGPGIQESDIGPPWDSISNVQVFADFVKAQALALQPVSGVTTTGCGDGTGNNRNGPCYVDPPTGTYSNSGNWNFGTPASPRFTFIDGNASVSGGTTGAGIMVVNGNLDWAGTPDFKGLIVVLGGSFTISGGGGGDTVGSIIVANTLNPTLDGGFGPATLDIAGGGNHNIQFDCDLLRSQWQTMLGADPRWEPECGPGDPNDPLAKGPPEPSITSWRESLGWRRSGIWNAVLN
jgi:hypothetical protein